MYKILKGSKYKIVLNTKKNRNFILEIDSGHLALKSSSFAGFWNLALKGIKYCSVRNTIVLLVLKLKF